MDREETIIELEKIFRKVTGNSELCISEKTLIGGSICNTHLNHTKAIWM